MQRSRLTHCAGIVGRRVIPTQYDGTVRLVPALFQHCELSDLLALTGAELALLLSAY